MYIKYPGLGGTQVLPVGHRLLQVRAAVVFSSWTWTLRFWCHYDNTGVFLTQPAVSCLSRRLSGHMRGVTGAWQKWGRTWEGRVALVLVSASEADPVPLGVSRYVCIRSLQVLQLCFTKCLYRCKDAWGSQHCWWVTHQAVFLCWPSSSQMRLASHPISLPVCMDLG